MVGSSHWNQPARVWTVASSTMAATSGHRSSWRERPRRVGAKGREGWWGELVWGR